MMYLDNAASTWPKPDRVIASVQEWVEKNGANPGRSNHRPARKARRRIQEVRQKMANFLHIENYRRIIFCPGATFALNTVVKGVLEEGDRAVVSSLAHNSVLRPLKHLEQNRSVSVTEVEPDAGGRLSPGKLREQLTADSDLVVITHGSNVIGTVQPVADLVTTIRDVCGQRCDVLLDAAQTAGRIELRPDDWGVDYVAFSGHKGLFGIHGAGVLCVPENPEIPSLVQGGTGSQSHLPVQPHSIPDRFEAGTASTPAILSMGAGISFLREVGLEQIRSREQTLRMKSLRILREMDGIQVFNPDLENENIGNLRGPNILFGVEGEDPAEISYQLDERFDIAVRPGLHCAPFAHRFLRTGGEDDRGAIRVAPGYFNEPSHIEQFGEALRDVTKRRVRSEG